MCRWEKSFCLARPTSLGFRFAFFFLPSRAGMLFLPSGSAVLGEGVRKWPVLAFSPSLFSPFNHVKCCLLDCLEKTFWSVLSLPPSAPSLLVSPSAPHHTHTTSGECAFLNKKMGTVIFLLTCSMLPDNLSRHRRTGTHCSPGSWAVF